MTLSGLFKYAARNVKNQSPTILAIIGSAGVVATAVTAVRATPKAMRRCDGFRMENDREPTKFEIVKETWSCYVPSALIGVGTIASIFGANLLSRKQLASVTSAYILLDRTYREYKRKVVNILDEDGEKEIHREIVKDHYTNGKKSSDEDTSLFFVDHNRGMFESTLSKVRMAEYELNRRMAKDGDVSLNDFFDLLGLPRNGIGAILGWSIEGANDKYNYGWIEFEHELVTMDDGMECYIINTPYEPDPMYLPF